jgi:hypothetical protein
VEIRRWYGEPQTLLSLYLPAISIPACAAILVELFSQRITRTVLVLTSFSLSGGLCGGWTSSLLPGTITCRLQS